MRQRSVLKRYLAVVLVIALMLSTMPVTPLMAAITEASDITGHWAEEVIRRWQEQGLISGYEDGTIRPNNPRNPGRVHGICKPGVQFPRGCGG